MEVSALGKITVCKKERIRIKVINSKTRNYYNTLDVRTEFIRTKSEIAVKIYPEK